MRDVSQIERQLYILTLLSSGKEGYTISEIHKNLVRQNYHLFDIIKVLLELRNLKL